MHDVWIGEAFLVGSHQRPRNCPKRRWQPCSKAGRHVPDAVKPFQTLLGPFWAAAALHPTYKLGRGIRCVKMRIGSLTLILFTLEDKLDCKQKAKRPPLPCQLSMKA